MSDLRAVAAIAGVAALCWVLAQLALWLHFSDQARADRQHHLAGQSQLYFALDRPTDLIGGQALGVQSQSFSSDGLLLGLAEGPSNVPIGFDGRCLNGNRFPIFTLDLESSRPFLLALAHSPIIGGEQRVAELPLRAGASLVQVDLRELPWRADQQPRGLGDDNGLVCEFRLVPVASEPTQLRLRRLRFSLVANVAAEGGWTDAIALRTGWQRPERVLQQRDLLQTHADREIWPGSLPERQPTLESATLLRLVNIFALLLALIALVLTALRGRPAITLGFALAGLVLLLTGNRLNETGDLYTWSTIGASVLALSILAMRSDQPPVQVLGSTSAWREAMFGTGVVLLFAVLFHRLDGTVTPSWPDHSDIARYVVWAAAQQTLLQRVLIPVLNRPSGSILSALPAATAFALLHTPNLSLMLLCLTAGIWWSKHFAKHRSWLPLIAAHAMLGTILPLLLPSQWLYSAEVGARFFAVP